MGAIEEMWTRRLANWALWHLSGNSPTMTSAYDGWDFFAPPRPPQPLVGEASDTEALIVKLPLELQKAITAKFVWSVPETMAERARILGIHPNTLTDRVKAAIFRLDDLDQAKRLAMRKMKSMQQG